ncbi:hypothetical protein AB1Y20_016922 [Prymnesium parvum]|uniref:Uncharacterized protein n=1 Tax=Prymnesium parvum TaxID=97485 RepID=A0AB34ID97_PRYPA
MWTGVWKVDKIVAHRWNEDGFEFLENYFKSIEVKESRMVTVDLPRPTVHPPRWEQHDRGINDRVNSFGLLVQRPPSLSSRAIQEPNDHARAFLYRGEPMPHNDVQPPQNGAKRESILYDRAPASSRAPYRPRRSPRPHLASIASL